VPEDPFLLECDRLSMLVNPTQYEQLRWSREDGPMLARLVALAFEALEDRPEIEMTEEGATKDVKRFILKVHSNRIAAISIYVEAGLAMFRIEPIERSNYLIASASPVSIAFEDANEQWVADALQELFSRIGNGSAD
jgi:collagenase-like PrtC family protease